MFTVTKTSRIGFSWVTIDDFESAKDIADGAKLFCPDTQIEVWDYDKVIYSPS